MNIINNLIGFLSSLSIGKFIRIFWFFFFFDLIPFFYGMAVLIIWRCRLMLTQKKRSNARKILFLKKPFASIIIPGRNEGENFYKLLNSLKQQTYQNFEII